MLKTPLHKIPTTGWKGLIQNWRNDLIAAVSVSLVALPLALGIAVASNMAPISGLITAVIGGLVTTFFRGSYVGINGPAAGLIAVVLTCFALLEDGSGRTVNYVVAAIFVTGAIQVVLGVLKLGRYGEMFPSSVIHGVLAAIGLIILSKQIHVALGTTPDPGNTIETLVDIFRKIPDINPFVAIISLVGILLLIFHARISYKFFHFFPAPIWVLLLALPFVYWFNFSETHDASFFGKMYTLGPEFMISLPDNLLDGIIYPDFSKIHTGKFWLAVMSITLIASIETLAIAKAVDKLDPYQRKTDLNKDLIGLGLATMASGALGGLPIITVIVRSTVNVHNNAKTKWSNLYHGLLLLLFILLLAPILQMVPLAALAAILVFTGFKLAAPRVFQQAYEQGMEQLLFVAGTLIITLFTDLLTGIIGGILLTLSVHILLARMPINLFFKMVFKSGSHLRKKEDGSYELYIKGIANFLSMLQLNKLLSVIPTGTDVKINLSKARLVDLTVLENLNDFKRSHKYSGGKVKLTGMDNHVASAQHRLALKSLLAPVPQRLSPRQNRMKQMAVENGWTYRREVDWDASYLRNFQFFETRPIEQKSNAIAGEYPDLGVHWEISDITFDEGVLMATEVYHTTIQVLQLPYKIPRFILEAEGLFDKVFDRVMAFSGQRDIDFRLFTTFSDKFLLKGDDEDAIRTFFNPEMIRFLEGSSIYHIESNGEALLIFKYLRLARTQHMEKMIHFSEELLEKIGR